LFRLRSDDFFGEVTPPTNQLYAVPRATAAEGMLPARLGGYQLMAKLAVGGMAEVYLARHGELAGFRTLVVVKKVLPHLASHPEFITMFLDEARIASLLDHPNVVRIIEVGHADEEFFLAMELVQGKPLSSLIRRAMDRKEPLPPKIAAWIVAQAAAGLHHAHELTDASGQLLHLVHRDVSPQNILISFEGAVKVIDFGIARALGRLTDTAAGQIKGKFAYMAPEHGTGQEIGSWTDIFALGVVLWESLCGRRLFARQSDMATMRAILEEPIPRPSTLVKTPPGLEAIAMRALARDPRDRFESAQKMREALERYTVVAGGVSGGDLAALMKEYFAEERSRWQSTTRLALEAESPVASPSTRELKLSQTSIPVGSVIFRPRTTVEAPVVVVSPYRRLLLAGAIAAAVAFLAVTIAITLGRRPPRAHPMVTPVTVPAPAAATPLAPVPALEPQATPEATPGPEVKARPHPRPAPRPVHRTVPRLDVPSDRRPNPF
jgi:serine/threonine protein kinase